MINDGNMGAEISSTRECKPDYAEMAERERKSKESYGTFLEACHKFAEDVGVDSVTSNRNKASSFPELMGMLALKENYHRKRHENYVKLADKQD